MQNPWTKFDPLGLQGGRKYGPATLAAKRRGAAAFQANFVQPVQNLSINTARGAWAIGADISYAMGSGSGSGLDANSYRLAALDGARTSLALSLGVATGGSGTFLTTAAGRVSYSALSAGMGDMAVDTVLKTSYGQTVTVEGAVDRFTEGTITGSLGGLANEAVDIAKAANFAGRASEAASPASSASEVAVRPTMEVSKLKTPAIAENIESAQGAGHPSTLTRVEEKSAIRANRRAALRGHTAGEASQSLDEYPLASTAEGGAGSQVRSVPRSEQNVQGGQVSQFYQKNNVRDGDKFHVKVVD